MKKTKLDARSGLLVALLFAQTATAEVDFVVIGDSVASAEWEIWTFGPSYPGFGPAIVVPAQGPGSQGAAQATTSNGVSFTASEVSTTITNDYDAFPGGLVAGGDRYYIHNGAFDWNVSGTLSENVDYIRISYGLPNPPESQGGGSATNFGVTPTLAGADITDAAFYLAGDSTVFYTTFEYTTATSTLDISFGDFIFGGPAFPGSFQSMDAILIEAFQGAAPVPVPEPHSFGLLSGLLAMVAFIARRRRAN